MRLSPDPHRAALQTFAIKSKAAWLRDARQARRRFFCGRALFHGYMRECVAMARRASRSSWQINRSPN